MERKIRKKETESKEQKVNRLRKAQEQMRKNRENETTGQRENRLKKDREQKREKRQQTESKEQKVVRLRKAREQIRKKQETETKQQREERLKRDREQKRRVKKTETKRQKEERLNKRREADSRRKRSESGKDQTMGGDLKQTSYYQLIVNFHKLVATGPTFVCICCDQLWYKHSLARVETVLKLDNEAVLRCIRTKEKCSTVQWVCHTCYNHLKKSKVPPCAVQNKMSFPSKPDHLDLTELEWRLVSPRLIFQKIHEAARGEQFKIHGNIVNVPDDVINTVNILPRLSTETDTIKVQLKRKLKYKNYVLSQNIRTSKVFEAAKWLTENAVLYQQESIKLNPEWNDLFTGCKENDTCNDSACSSSSNLGKMKTPVPSNKSVKLLCNLFQKMLDCFHLSLIKFLFALTVNKF